MIFTLCRSSRRWAPPLALLALLAMTAGCARDTHDYPSLAPRAVEKLGFAEPETTPVIAAPEPALDATIADDRRDLARIADGFDAAAAKAEAATRAARGQAVGSDAWLDAQTLISALDEWRGQGTVLVQEIDALIAERAAALKPVYTPLTTLRGDVAAVLAKQNDTMDRLSGSLPNV